MSRRSKKNALASELESFKPKKDKEIQKINLGDGASLKRVLDETATTVIQEAGYKEDQALNNVKIGGGLFTCGVAALAQFYPKKYPENFWLLLICVALYILSSLALNYIFSGVEGDVFFVSKMPRFSDQYSLFLGEKSQGWRKGLDSSEVLLEASVTEFFDSDGCLVEKKYKDAVAAALKKCKIQRKTQ